MTTSGDYDKRYGIDILPASDNSPSNTSSTSLNVGESEFRSGTADINTETVRQIHELLTDNSESNWISESELELLLRTEQIDLRWLLQEGYRKQAESLSSPKFSDTIIYEPTLDANDDDPRIKIIGISAILSVLFVVLTALFAMQGFISGGVAFAISSVLIAYSIGAGKTWFDYR